MEQDRFHRIRLSSIDPHEVTEPLVRLMAAAPAVCPHLHVPLQAADDGVLQSMRRRYDVALAAERLAMIIDPLGEDPLVITGSANFSDASTRKNDENMLVIRGDRRVADIYLSEFMRLFNHFQFRGLVRARRTTGPESARSFLVPDDSWKDRYYQPGTPKYLERLYFAGHP